MKKSSVRAFGIACFVIGAGYGVYDKLNTDPHSTIDEQAIAEYEEKITQLEQQLDEAKNQINQIEQEEQQGQDQLEKVIETDSTENNSNEEVQLEANNMDTPNDIIHATLHIYSGLTPYDIGKKLEDLGIVENGLELELYLAKPEYAKSIQIGQYELNSSMTFKEIANLITGKS
ncbi:hypothetical protein MTP04_22990 [Lysinibacillus sp. PLM2]|nr:hypothetical protein MTP04_22990 [Lysinibacillus sp. PLM2]